MNTQRPVEDADERRAALLALAATAPSHDGGPCPTPEELAALQENRLEPERRAAVLAHLDRHPPCYREWLAVAAARAAWRDGGDMVVAGRARPGGAWRLLLPLALAAGLGGLLLLPAPNSSGPDGSIAGEYRRLLEAGYPGHLAATLTLPWEASAEPYGLAAPAAPADHQRAFAAGLWLGRERLRTAADTGALPALLSPEPRRGGAPVSAWSRTAWTSAFQLGQWVMLVEAACDQPRAVPPGFWSRQFATIDALEAAYRTLAAEQGELQPVGRQLAGLKDAVGAVQDEQGAAGPCRALRVNLHTLKALAAPSRLDGPG